MISFEQVFGRSRGCHLKVKWTTNIGKQGAKGGPRSLTVTIGRIKRAPDGLFRYLESEANELHPSLVDKDLGTLKRRIKAHVKR